MSETGIEVPANTGEIVSIIRSRLYDTTVQERNKYKKLYDVVLTYAKRNGVFISDIYKIAGDPNDIEALSGFHYSCYCSRPLEHATNITNLLYEELKDDFMLPTLVMSTAVKNEEFAISYDTRFIAKIYALTKMKNDGSLTKPVVIDGISYLPPEIEIINVYNMLYTGMGQLDRLLMFEERLSKYVLEKIGGEIDERDKTPSDESKDENKNKDRDEEDIIVGEIAEDAAEAIVAGAGIGGSTCYERKKDEVEALKISICKNFLPGRKDVVLLGPIGIDWVRDQENICPKFDRLQLISSLQPHQLKTEIERYLNQIGKRYNISVSDELDLQIPKDFRTKRVVFSIAIKTDFGMREKPFLEYFNSADFELIPAFNSGDILVATKYVLMRFLYIDLWIFKYVFSIGKMDPTSYKQKQRRLIDLIHLCAKMINVADGTIGKYVEYEISKKELINDQDKFFVPYYPIDYVKKHGTLRKI